MHPLARLDHAHLWHPFTQMRDWLDREPIVVVSGKGAILRDVRGREYLDANWLVPKPDKIVVADINEPAFTSRVPGAVIYARPGDRLRIHVKNADIMPHSIAGAGYAPT